MAELPLATDEKHLSRQVILVGYGRVGQRIGETLAKQNIPYLVVEQNRELVKRLRERGMAAVSGDASALLRAHIAQASLLVLAIPDTFNVRQIIEAARRLNPEIETVVRTHNEEEATLLAQEGATKVFLGENELSRHVLERFGKVP